MIRLIFFFSFLFFSFLYSKELSQSKIINLALKKKLYKTETFKALLFYNKKFYIKDKRFYLSKNISLKNELITDIKGFFKNKNKFKNIDNHPQCRFPARFFFLKKELNLSDKIFPKINCPSLLEYKNKAPADNIYIVFASANLKDPSSMMGHTFFKYEGINYRKRKVSHAISFFTLINTLNPLKLIYKNIGPGMKGFFVLKPYDEILYNYLENENRNVWEYKLKLNNYQKKLIYYHIWELKDIKMKYYFTSFNCATVDLFIVAAAKPSLMKEYKFYITPLDLIKKINKQKLIFYSRLIPSDEWFIKLIEGQLSFFMIYKIKNLVENEDINELKKINNFYEKLLIQTYSIYLFKKHKISKKSMKQILNNVKIDNFNLDISKYKNPLKTPYQRQIGLSYFKDYDDKKYLSLNFLPASHILNDNNREYFNESELKLANLKILFSKEKVLLENFDIYNMTNLIPFDILIKPISYDFALNLKRDYNKNLDKQLYFNIKLGIGEDLNLQKDINLFCLLNVKLRFHKNSQFLVNPVLGMSIYTIGNGKILIKYSKNYKLNSFIYNKFTITYNKYLDNLKLYFRSSFVKSEKELEFGFMKYF
jgi:hypothetical protein